MPSPPVTLIPATPADRATIANLIQLYLYDMAAEAPFPVQDNGLYDYGYLDQFWDQAYLVRVHDELAGFALVIPRCPIMGTAPCWFMAEFFVLRPYRRTAVGRTAFHAIPARHPGQWHIATTRHNPGADRFWSKVIPVTPVDPFQTHHDGRNWVVRSFVIPRSGD